MSIHLTFRPFSVVYMTDRPFFVRSRRVLREGGVILVYKMMNEQLALKKTQALVF